MTVSDPITRLLRPASIAVVGASQAANKLAGQVIPSLKAGGYKGRIIPVNPRYEEVAGERCYPSVAAVDAPVDHCIIVVAKERVRAVLAECRAKGVGSASIFSSGYAETGETSAQDELRKAAGGMVFIGPNCMGFVNLVDGVFAAPAPVFGRDSAPGEVALLSQSGGLAYATLAFFAQQMGLRFSYVVNTGNSAGISFTDLVAFTNADPTTKVTIAVAESEQVVGEVVEAVRRQGLPKPIVLLKLGRGATGARMALSHTGSLAGDYRLVRDCAEQHGIVCIDDVDEALGAAELLRTGFDARNADGLAAISISGGNVTLFADHVDAAGLSFAELAHGTEARLKTVLPDYISVHNPIDITALGYEEPGLHTRVLDVLVEDPAVRTLVPIITTAVDYTPVCSLLADMKQQTAAPIIALWTGGSYENESPELLKQAGIPIFRSAGTLVRTLAAMKRAAEGGALAPRDEAGQSRPAPAVPPGEGPLRESEGLAILEAGGVPVPRWRRVAPDALKAAAAEIGYPVVVKADMAETHISDAGGVILGIAGEADLDRAWPRIAALPGDEVLVLQFKPGEELLASTFRHPVFGPVLMAGSGGRLVELLKDVAFAALPVSRAALSNALRRTAVGRALHEGFRGATGFEAALDLLERLAALQLAAGDALAQIELNPVTVGPHGATAVDAALVRRTQDRP
jgi:acyl-CoA synthetase (NDP forming)